MGRENGLTAGQTSQNDRGVLPLPQFDSISDADRKLVADQAAPLLLQLQGPRLGGPGAPMVLGTSIGEEMITPEWVNAENDDVAKTALRATGQTISIVQTKDPGAGIGGAPASSSPVVGYVRHAGGTGKDTSVQITAVSGSEIAGRIRDALDRIEANVPGDPTVRVLTAPAYQLTALGLYSGATLTGILAVTAPPSGLPIENRHVYSPSEFRGLLRRVLPAGGIIP